MASVLVEKKHWSEAHAPGSFSRRDRIAAPMRLASWIRFETIMTSEDWEGAISLLVSHRPDKDLLQLLQMCVAGQQIASMEEAQALPLKNFRDSCFSVLALLLAFTTPQRKKTSHKGEESPSCTATPSSRGLCSPTYPGRDWPGLSCPLGIFAQLVHF